MLMDKLGLFITNTKGKYNMGENIMLKANFEDLLMIWPNLSGITALHKPEYALLL